MALSDWFLPLKKMSQAVRTGDAVTARQLAERHPKLRQRPEFLKDACNWGRAEVAAALLEVGPKPSVGVLNDLLDTAANTGRNDVVRVLLDHGADVNSSNGKPLLRAADWCYDETVALLLSRGAVPSPAAMKAAIRSSSNTADKRIKKSLTIDVLLGTRAKWKNPFPNPLQCTTCLTETLPQDAFERACAAEGLRLVNGNLYGTGDGQRAVEKYREIEGRKAFRCERCNSIFCMSCLFDGARLQRVDSRPSDLQAARPATPGVASAPVAAAPSEPLPADAAPLEANQLLRYRAASKAKADAQIAFTDALLACDGAPKVRLVLFRSADAQAEFPWLILKAGTTSAIHSYAGSGDNSDRVFASLFGDQPRSIIWADHVAENCPRPGEAVTERGRQVYEQLIRDLREGRYVVDRIVRA
jgi:hypothetical protein